jgi:hypothetical protein
MKKELKIELKEMSKDKTNHKKGETLWKSEKFIRTYKIQAF